MLQIADDGLKNVSLLGGESKRHRITNSLYNIANKNSIKLTNICLLSELVGIYCFHNMNWIYLLSLLNN